MSAGAITREEDWSADDLGSEELQPSWTAEDEAAWQAVRAEQKAWELANWDKRCRRIEALFADCSDRGAGAPRSKEDE